MFYKDIILGLISNLLLVICVLVGVAFLTLLERKVLNNKFLIINTEQK